MPVFPKDNILCLQTLTPRGIVSVLDNCLSQKSFCQSLTVTQELNALRYANNVSVKVPLPGRHMQDLDPSKILIELTLNVVVNHTFWQKLFAS